MSSTTVNHNEYIFPIKERFKLTDNFVKAYEDKQPNWGPLGYITFKRTYSAKVENENRLEEWHETCKRVVEGCFTIQLNHCKNMRLPWNAHKAQKSAQDMYTRLFEFKWMPPGRGLANMGMDFIYKRGSAHLFNCSAITSEFIDKRFSDPFIFMMDFSMCGVGVSFDVLGAGKVKFSQPKKDNRTFIIEDSKEGWCSIVKCILEAYVGKDTLPKDIDYSHIRKAGTPIVTSGGTAPGPQILIECVDFLIEFLDARIHKVITSSDIVDIMNVIGKCVVSGGKRRSAQLSVGYADDSEYISLKDPSKYQEELMSHRWASNNSVYAYEGMDYSKVSELTKLNGEPGYIYLDKMQNYGRIKDGFQEGIDEDVNNVNPCIPLSSKLLTSHGIKELRDVYVGDQIWSKEGWTTITAKWKTGVKPLIELKTSRGSLICTPDHKIVQDGIKIEACEALSLDFFPSLEFFEGIGTRTSYAKITEKVELPEEEVWDITVDNASHTFWCNGFNISNCGEISLSGGNGSGGELCNIGDILPSLHDSFDDFKQTIKCAYLYCKTVTLIPTHNEYTNALILKNRRIGISQTGIVQAIQKHGMYEYFRWCDNGYEYVKALDKKYSNWLCIQRSIKLTTVKPAGSISLLPGVTPGIHFDHDRFYIRRIRVENTFTSLINALKKANYECEESAYGDGTLVFSFPIKAENFSKGKHETNIYEQIELGAKMQYYWADNSVSQTVHFTKHEGQFLKDVLEMYEDRLKTISFLPLSEHGYVQAPYESITEEKYLEMSSKLKSLKLNKVNRHGDREENKYCDGDKCEIQLS